MFSRALATMISIACAVAACSGDTDDDSRDAAAGSGGASASSGAAGTGGAAGSGAAGGAGASAGRGGQAGSAAAAGVAGASGAGAAGATGGSGSAGRDGGVPDAPVSCPEGGTPDASAEDAIRASCTVALARVSRLDEECSGLGGTHVTFAVIEVGRGAAVTVLSHGGHGYFAGQTGPRAVGEYFVVGVDPLGSLTPRPDNGAWCITGLPAVDGEAHTLLRATSEADARSRMRALLGTTP